MKLLVVVLALTITLCCARPAEKKDNGDGVVLDVYDERGSGTVVHGSGQKTWESDDGKTEVKIYGDWSKVSNGPKAGPPDHKLGGSVRFKFDR
ncbi:uncharacterized protein [Anabrus simplex]|uniref:uncharacterized protein n=1 Tax=Anabrus simplex TaxID=316456 RepID=UPI0035A36DA0